MTLGLTIKDEQLAGYSLSVGTEVLSDDPEVSGVIMDYTSSMDENDRLEAHMVMDLAQLFSIDMNMTGSYTPGTAAPETEPPAGVNIIPFSEMAEM